MEFDEIMKLIHAVSESNLESFTVERGDFKLSLKNKETRIIYEGKTQEGSFQKSEENENLFQNIVSPLVGTFYDAKSENSEPFISVGDEVKEGQVVGIIEAMKLMNEVTSCVNGIVEEILVENEQGVEYGQPLVRIKLDGK